MNRDFAFAAACIAVGLLSLSAFSSDNGPNSGNVCRSMTALEAAEVIGGMPERECGPVALCGVVGPTFCYGSSQASCTSHKTECVPVSGAGTMACNVYNASNTVCTEGMNNDCNIEYECAWSAESSLCYRSTVVVTTERAPSSCNAF